MRILAYAALGAGAGVCDQAVRREMRAVQDGEHGSCPPSALSFTMAGTGRSPVRHGCMCEVPEYLHGLSSDAPAAAVELDETEEQETKCEDCPKPAKVCEKATGHWLCHDCLRWEIHRMNPTFRKHPLGIELASKPVRVRVWAGV